MGRGWHDTTRLAAASRPDLDFDQDWQGAVPVVPDRARWGPCRRALCGRHGVRFSSRANRASQDSVAVF